MANVMCGFCNRENVEDVCGDLYEVNTVDDGPVAAHHKCMKYSANLTQYKVSSFGGFDISDVLKEQERGRELKCSICAPKKMPKKKHSYQYYGASAGCAVKSCSKCFHYYCAYTDDTAITKKLEEKQTVFYRVYCSMKHERQFEKREFEKQIKAFKDEKPGDNYDKNDDDSDENNEDERDSGGKEYSEEEDDDDDNDSNMVDSDTDDSNYKVDGKTAVLEVEEEYDDDDDDDDDDDEHVDGKIAVLEVEEEDDDDDDDDDDEVEEDDDDDDDDDYDDDDDDDDEHERKQREHTRVQNFKLFKSTKKTLRPRKSINQDENENESISKKRKHSSQISIDKASKKVRNSQIYGQSNGKGFKAVLTDSSSDTEKDDSLHTKLQQTLRKEADKKPIRKANTNIKKKQSVDTVALCIVGDTKCPLNFSRKLKEAVSKTHKLNSERFFIWQNLEDSPTLSKQNIVCFIKDLVEHYIAGDREEVEKLLFDRRYLEKKEKTEYRLQGSFLQDLGDHVLQQTQQHAWSFVKSQLKDTKIGSVIEVEETSNLVLLFDGSGIDREGRMWKTLGTEEEVEEEAMCLWTSATVVTKIMEEDDDEICTREKDTILTWLKEKTKSANVYIYPSEEALKAESGDTSVAEDVASKLSSSKTHKRVTSTILVFKQMDKEVVMFVPYCRKVFQSHLSQFKSDHSLLVFFDIRSLSSGCQDKLRDVFIDNDGKRMEVPLSSAFNPSSVPISCVVAQVTHTDFKQSNRVRESPKSTANSHVNGKDNAIPSTSSTRR